MQCLEKTRQYQNDKNFYDGMVGRSDLKKCIEMSEEFSCRLVRRYKEKKERSQRKPDDIKILNPTLSAGSKTDDGQKRIIRMINEHFITMTPKNLYSIINQKSKTYLLIDIRPAKDFQVSRIKSSYCVNVPENLLHPGVTASQIYTRISVESKRKWDRRKHVDMVIMLDWFGKDMNDPSSPLRSLIEAMYKWDGVSQENPYTCSKPYLLVGGFDNFILHYPLEVTVAKAGRDLGNVAKTTMMTKSKNNSLPSIANLESPNGNNAFAGPSWTMTDVKPRVPDRRSKPKLKSPTVDRLAKAKILIAKASVADEKPNDIAEVLEAEEDLIDASVQLLKKELVLEHEWELLRLKIEKEAEDALKEGVIHKEENTLEEQKTLLARIKNHNEELRLQLQQIKSQMDTKEQEVNVDNEAVKKKGVEKAALQDEVKQKRIERIHKMRLQFLEGQLAQNLN